jgi:hypothetical protein
LIPPPFTDGELNIQCPTENLEFRSEEKRFENIQKKNVPLSRRDRISIEKKEPNVPHKPRRGGIFRPYGT